MGPGSVHMSDAVGSDEEQEYCQSDDLDSEDYCSSENDETDIGLAEAAPAATKVGPPYRIIDADMLKRVQVKLRINAVQATLPVRSYPSFASAECVAHAASHRWLQSCCVQL